MTTSIKLYIPQVVAKAKHAFQCGRQSENSEVPPSTVVAVAA
jgi:hypothetical protein